MSSAIACVVGDAAPRASVTATMPREELCVAVSSAISIRNYCPTLHNGFELKTQYYIRVTDR